VVNWFHRRRLDQSPLGKYGFEFESRTVDGYDLQEMRQEYNSSHARNNSGISNMLWHTLPGFRSEFWPSTRTQAIDYSKFTTNVSTSILDPRSNLMPTPARVSEQVSASVPESRLFVRRTASDPNDFVKGMSIAISTAERIR
jgi:hypothetical protein